MPEIRWLQGWHQDKWIAQTAVIQLVEVEKLGLKFFLPPKDDGLGKVVTLSVSEEELARGFISRGKLTMIEATLPSGLTMAEISIRLDHSDEVSGDIRSLGAICVAARLNDADWTPTTPQNVMPISPPSSGTTFPRSADILDKLKPAEPSGVVEPARHEIFADVYEYFDAKFYRAHDEAPEGSDHDLFEHYLQYGWLEGLDPSADFSTSFYLDNDPDLRPNRVNPLVHWVRFGRSENRTTRPPAASPRGDTRATVLPVSSAPPSIESAGLSKDDLDAVAGLFDRAFYAKQSSELANVDFDLLQHYMTVGWKHRLDPSPSFSTSYYLRSNPDIESAGLNPLLHYVRSGQTERRPTAPYTALLRTSYKPLVSVVVPNYNHARFLVSRLTSIFQQSYDNIELILLDDGSTDDSQTVLDELATHSPVPVKKLYNECNSGNVFSQWEKGFQMASGELVWLCESDDICEPAFLETLVPYFADRAVMLAFGRIQFCDVASRQFPGLDTYRDSAEPGIWSKPVVRPAAEWFAKAFGRNNVIANVGGSLIRNQKLDPAIWQEARTYRICGDWYLYNQLAGGGRIAFDPNAVSYFRQHGLNTSAKNFDKLYYYEEHRKIFLSLNTSWDIPATTQQGFLRSIGNQWRQHGLASIHGEITDWLLARMPDSLKRQQHILIGSLGFSVGGGELFPINLANSLVKHGQRVSMLCFNLNEMNSEIFGILDTRVAVYDAAEAKMEGPRTFLNRIGATIVHSHVINIDDLFFKHALSLDKFPYVVTLHGSHQGADLNIDALLFRMLRRVTRWVYTADRNLEIFENLPLGKEAFRKIPNAMPLDNRPFPSSRKELRIDDDAVIFAFVARGVQQKGWRATIQALKLLQKRHPDLKIHLLMVGSGVKTTEAVALATADLPVTFLGFQSCINGLYRLADCALVPTRFDGESFPLCVIQALQEGLPVIATDVGEIRSMISCNGKTAGIIVDNIRESTRFAEAVYQAMLAMTDSETRSDCAALSKELGKRFDLEEVTQQYLLLYNEATEAVASNPRTPLATAFASR